MSDFEMLKELLQKANQYSIEISGIPQWTKWDVVYDQLQAYIESGCTYVVRDSQDEITSVIAIDAEDEVWGDASKDNLAIYLHQLAKDPEKAPPGSGLRLIHFAAAEAARKGKKYLRCDTSPELIDLVEYYHRLGFEEAGTFIYESSDRPGMLLEASTLTVIKSISKL
jgi:predicted N-acetyltransferase YhbS